MSRDDEHADQKIGISVDQSLVDVEVRRVTGSETLNITDENLPEFEYKGCLNELTTTYEDNLGSFGNMFDIHTYDDIQFYGIDIYTDVEKSVDFEIYTKANAFAEDGGNVSIDAWTLLINGTTIGRGRLNPTPIRGFKVVNIPSQVTMGFYVTLTTPDLRYRDIRAEMINSTVGVVYSKNEDLEIRVGVSVGEYPFSPTFFESRAWSGTLHYVPNTGCPSAAPSSLPVPSASPSVLIETEFPSVAPSILLTVEPTRAQAGLGNCTDEGTLETTMQGGTGAYGSMFTVKSKNATVSITSLSFHSDFTEGLLTAQVYTKAGDFIGYESAPESWKQISESVLVGEGTGLRTKIPTDDFEAIIMRPHELRAFYMTLTTADIRYTRTNKTLGEPVAQNKFISVNVGAGLADFPFATKFFIYEPREFNGAVHFETTAECLPSGDVLYVYNVHHTPGMREVDVIRIITNNVQSTMEGLFKDDPEVIKYATKSKVKLVKTASIVPDQTCQPISAKFECTRVEVRVTLKHAPALRWGDIKYFFLQFNEDVTLNINLEFQAQYVGDRPAEQGTKFTLGSDSPLRKMTPAQSAAFENAIFDFLVGPLKEKGVVPLSVKVNSQVIHGNGDKRRLGTRRQQSSGGSIDISTSITGEYRPPPEVNYDGVVSDALDASNPDLQQRINRADKYFEVINSVEAVSDTGPSGGTKATMAQTSTNSIPVVPVVAGIGGFFVVAFLFWCLKRYRKNQELKKWNQQLNLDSDVLDSRWRRFGGLFGKKKPKNFINDFAGDAEVSGWNELSHQHASFDDNYNSTQKNIYGDNNDDYLSQQGKNNHSDWLDASVKQQTETLLYAQSREDTFEDENDDNYPSKRSQSSMLTLDEYTNEDYLTKPQVEAQNQWRPQMNPRGQSHMNLTKSQRSIRSGIAPTSSFGDAGNQGRPQMDPQGHHQMNPSRRQRSIRSEIEPTSSSGDIGNKGRPQMDPRGHSQMNPSRRQRSIRSEIEPTSSSGDIGNQGRPQMDPRGHGQMNPSRSQRSIRSEIEPTSSSGDIGNQGRPQIDPRGHGQMNPSRSQRSIRSKIVSISSSDDVGSGAHSVSTWHQEQREHMHTSFNDSYRKVGDSYSVDQQSISMSEKGQGAGWAEG